MKRSGCAVPYSLHTYKLPLTHAWLWLWNQAILFYFWGACGALAARHQNSTWFVTCCKYIVQDVIYLTYVWRPWRILHHFQVAKGWLKPHIKLAMSFQHLVQQIVVSACAVKFFPACNTYTQVQNVTLFIEASRVVPTRSCKVYLAASTNFYSDSGQDQCSQTKPRDMH